jgi:hypothetical protein
LNARVSDLFERAGALRPVYEAVDWSLTPLGPTDTWTPALRNALDLALGTRFAVTLFWGPEFVLLYNEAYVQMIAEKHPRSLGSRAKEVFPEAWDAIGPLMESVYAGSGATWVEDALVRLDRSGFLEDCYFTFSYSPVRGPDGEIQGVMDIATETTTRVVVGRRLELLTLLAERVGAVDQVADLGPAALEVLGRDTPDLPEVELLPPGTHTADPRDLAEDGHGRLVVPLPGSDATVQGSALRVRPNPGLRRDEGFDDFLRLLAATLGRAMDRILAIEAERSFSAALQVSLLTQPVATPGLDLAVRYVPAVEVAQIGGDWYDAFRLPDGSLSVVVGDVAGHDQDAAAAMAQLRNLARGVAYSLPGSPADVLNRIDRAMEGLGIDVVATVVMLHIDGDDVGVARWSNAGHPPPVVVAPDGTARLLATKPDLLLGIDPELPRADHAVGLEPGTMLVLYTDGLVERRGASIGDGLDWLVQAVEGRPGLSADDMCTFLLDQVAGSAEDDVALLVLRAL